ncbi:hypothetical protein [Paenibacillus sp. SN-8-1]|uniref:hypothetical protein n=1 Tax=Paenibacillus sp. SN-8-1 TaxID=3435409 RepID=UPI003D9AAD95
MLKMNKLGKKLFAGTLSCVILLTGATSAFADNATTSSTPVQKTIVIPSVVPSVVPSSDLITSIQPAPSNGNGQFETNGIKSWITKKALQGVASALRAGARNEWVQKIIVDYLDAGSAKVFRNNLSGIADMLDEIVAAGNFAESYVKRILWEGLEEITGEKSVSFQIADAVTAIIFFLL